MRRMLGAAFILGAALWGWLDQYRERRRVRETRSALLTALRRMGE